MIVSRNHEIDREALAAALTQTGAGYIGMIGSKRKVRDVFDDLRRRGVPEEKLAKFMRRSDWTSARTRRRRSPSAPLPRSWRFCASERRNICGRGKMTLPKSAEGNSSRSSHRRCFTMGSTQIGERNLIWQRNGSGENGTGRKSRRERERWAGPSRRRAMKRRGEAVNLWRRVSTAAPIPTSGGIGSGSRVGNAGPRVRKWWPEESRKAKVESRKRSSGYSAGIQAWSCHQAARDSLLPRKILRSARAMFAARMG